MRGQIIVRLILLFVKRFYVVLAQRFGWVKEMLGLGNVNAAFGVGDAAEFGQFFALGLSVVFERGGVTETGLC